MPIRYLNDAANNIQYTNAVGEVITKNPFDAEFIFISQRLSLIHSNDAENRQRREHYERDVRNAQVSIDAGRPANVTLPVPLHLETPEDFELPADEDTLWDPPLLTLKPHVVSYPATGIGPDAHPVEVKIASMPLESKDALSGVLNVLTAAGPALPSLIELLRSLFQHHSATVK